MSGDGEHPPAGPVAGQAPAGTPGAEVAVDPGLVRALLAAQHPDLAGLELTPVTSGWDNVTYRLGRDLAVRLPRRSLAAALVAHEQRWLASLAPALPLPIPVVVRRGVPGQGFPWAWSVVPWFEGVPADGHPPDGGEAAVLGSFLRALHVPAPPDAPHNPYRGVPVRDRAEQLEVRLAALGEELGDDAELLRSVFAAGVDAALVDTPSWIHGDLHPRNILTAGGRLRAVIDWGDLGRGDPATDVAALWMCFGVIDHPSFWAAYGPGGPGLDERSRAWAVVFGAILLDVGLQDGDDRFIGVGRRTLARLVASAGPSVRGDALDVEQRGRHHDR